MGTLMAIFEWIEYGRRLTAHEKPLKKLVNEFVDWSTAELQFHSSNPSIAANILQAVWRQTQQTLGPFSWDLKITYDGSRVTIRRDSSAWEIDLERSN